MQLPWHKLFHFDNYARRVCKIEPATLSIFQFSKSKWMGFHAVFRHTFCTPCTYVLSGLSYQVVAPIWCTQCIKCKIQGAKTMNETNTTWMMVLMVCVESTQVPIHKTKQTYQKPIHSCCAKRVVICVWYAAIRQTNNMYSGINSFLSWYFTQMLIFLNIASHLQNNTSPLSFSIWVLNSFSLRKRKKEIPEVNK